LQVTLEVCGDGGSARVEEAMTEHVNREGTASVNDAVPLNPFKAVRVIVAVAEEPAIA